MPYCVIKNVLDIFMYASDESHISPLVNLVDKGKQVVWPEVLRRRSVGWSGMGNQERGGVGVEDYEVE